MGSSATKLRARGKSKTTASKKEKEKTPKFDIKKFRRQCDQQDLLGDIIEEACPVDLPDSLLELLMDFASPSFLEIGYTDAPPGHIMMNYGTIDLVIKGRPMLETAISLIEPCLPKSKQAIVVEFHLRWSDPTATNNHGGVCLGLTDLKQTRWSTARWVAPKFITVEWLGAPPDKRGYHIYHAPPAGARSQKNGRNILFKSGRPAGTHWKFDFDNDGWCQFYVDESPLGDPFMLPESTSGSYIGFWQYCASDLIIDSLSISRT